MQNSKEDLSSSSTKIAAIKNSEIRKTIHNNGWWFSFVDVAGALTDNVAPGAYWRKQNERLNDEGSEVVTICNGFKLEAPDGKMRETDCASAEGIFRIMYNIHSIKKGRRTI